MLPLKLIIATAVAAGFASASAAGNSTYVGGPKGSPAISAVRAPAVIDSHASMNNEPARTVTRSPWKGSVAGRNI